MKPNDSGSNYGSTVRAESEGRTEIPKQTFSISEPTYNEVHLNGSRHVSGTKAPKSFSCCRTSGKIRESMDGLRIIILSMFVFSVGVTVALVIHIAAESTGEVQDTDKVVTGHTSCSAIGDEVLALGGNAVDAAIAATFCMALMEPHITGLGGGGMMFIHQKRSNKSVVIDFREMAPAGAINDNFIKNPLLAQYGLSSIAIPGFVAGLEYAYEKFGSKHLGTHCCQWSDLLWKTIHLAFEGVHVSQHFKNATETKIDKDVLASNESTRLRDFVSPNGKPITEESVYSDIPIYNELIKTLKLIAQNGSEIFYHGSVGETLVKSLAGSITMDDLANYKVVEADPIVTDVGDFQIMTAPSPSAGPELLAFLNTLETYNETRASGEIDEDYLDTISRVLKRLNKFQLGLGDPSSEPLVYNRTEWLLNKNNTERWLSERGQSASLDESTSYTLAEAVSSHVAVMDKKDVYVAVVTSLNTWFGSKVMTENGILMNNALANFDFTSGTDQTSTSANQMAHLKRPLTSNVVAMATDITNICGRRIVLGGATPDAVGQVLNDPLFMKGDLLSSTSEARLVIWNETVYFEDAFKGFNPEVLANFRQKYEPGSQPLTLPYTSVNSLEKNLDVVLDVQDIRSLGDDDQSDEAGKLIRAPH